MVKSPGDEVGSGLVLVLYLKTAQHSTGSPSIIRKGIEAVNRSISDRNSENKLFNE